MRKWNVALGFYQNLSTADSVIKELKDNGFERVAYIHQLRDGHLVVKYIHNPINPFLILSILSVIVIAWSIAQFGNLNLGEFSLLSIFLALIGIAANILFLKFTTVNPQIVERFKKLVVKDEVLVLVQVKNSFVRDVVHILRHVKTGHPSSFLLRSDILNGQDEITLPKEPLTSEQLREKAISLASTMPVKLKGRTKKTLLLQRLKKSEQMLNFLRHDIAEGEHIEQTITLSAEWLLDNSYIIQGSIEEIQRNLPSDFYRELPQITEGALKGYPRIYSIAIEMVNSTAGNLTRENIVDFLNSYQSVEPLTIGELWALPLMLRLRLVEWVQYLAVQIDKRMRDGELASFWGNRLLQAVRQEPNLIPTLMKDLAHDYPTPPFHFGQELIEHLFDEEAVLPLVKNWLEECYKIPLPEVMHQEQMRETAEQISFSNAIKSMITLSQLSWQMIFETVSPVDNILKQDPSGIYSSMDFPTKNHYREIIESLSKHSHTSEVDISKKVLEMAHHGENELSRHVGFYIIDEGKKPLETQIGFNPSGIEKIRRFITDHPGWVYLGLAGGLTLLYEILFVFFALKISASLPQALILMGLSLIPVSEISIQIVNFIITKILPPTLFPKMSFKNEIPIEHKTLIVVPTLLSNANGIKEEIDHLEIRYLANSDPSLCFGIFSDYPDALEETVKGDEDLLDIAVKGVQELESKYGAGKFFLFHRKRVWSKSENAWIGWERKRGKIEYLNRFLLNEPLPENILYVGHADSLKGTQYVITLDSDTQLPKDQAKKLIEVISHPLNKAVLSPDGRSVIRGYTIFQPRVCTDFSHTKISLFTHIFSDPSSMDPYTRAISNVYQDLTGEGSYHGKGIYDVKAFNSVLSNRFNEEKILSHDLIEGAYVRTGFASDICLFDLYPKEYLSATKRQHRWVRGDWQIIDWIFPTIWNTQNEKIPNPLTWVSRWKIFDNLRRSLLPMSLLVLLLTGWFYSNLPAFWTLFTYIVILLPWITGLFSNVINFIFLKNSSWNDLSTTFLRSFISIALLPYEASLNLDAIFRSTYRQLFSHKKLLEWTPSNHVQNGKQIHEKFIFKLGMVSVFGLITLLAVMYFHINALFIALPFCILWILSPLFVSVIDKPIEKLPDEELTDNEREVLRFVARKTWRFFDEFVGPQSNWLPPDNYQAALKFEIAQRTSPTNIGLWFVALLDAYDFKYITLDQVIDRALMTTDTLKKLERYEGHYLNWYDIQTLNPLYPRYISTVDSGNLIACMWTMQQGLLELYSEPLFTTSILNEIKEGIITLLKKINTRECLKLVEVIHQTINPSDNNIAILLTELREVKKISFSLLEGVTDLDLKNSEDLYWYSQIDKEINAWITFTERYLSWVDVLTSLSEQEIEIIDKHANHWRNKVLNSNHSLKSIAEGNLLVELHELIESAKREDLPKELKNWGKKLNESAMNAQWLASEKSSELKQLANELHHNSEEINLKFLYNEDRKVFVIGYNYDEKRLDNSYYDLLASEARISSLVGIAKEDVPLEHWWILGRPYTFVDGQQILLSWGGTMFEYLMPLLFNKQYLDSLLGAACFGVVKCQIDYAKKRGIPWGISESAFSAIDSHKIYQYRSFGVPGLGLKRGLEEDLVISPYSTALALAIDPSAATKNIIKLINQPHSLLGPFGLYEAIDYTRQQSPTGERGVIVYAYMAHHQGMIFTAINNVLHNNIIPKRFHNDPRVSGVDALLYEKIPKISTVSTKGVRRDAPVSRLIPFSQIPIMGVTDTPESVTPKVNLLSNGQYSLMVTNTGGGYSQWKDIEITRWRSDTTLDNWGSFLYIKDMDSGKAWSQAFQPTHTRGQEYYTSFKTDKAEIRRKDDEIETLTDIIVSPEDNAEIRYVSLKNHSTRKRYLELTSYMELVLAAHNADRAHPAFNKLFIETEALPESSALLAFRRLRSPTDKPIWAAHIVATDELSKNEALQYETDRRAFIGRGRTLQRPLALERNLTNSDGTVLDPIFSLRKHITIEPGQTVHISFITAIADDRNGIFALIEKYKDLTASNRALELAWTYAQLELRHLRIHQEEVQLFQKLASRVLYPHSQLRASTDRIRNNRLGQSGLWAYGISGDLPIVLVTVGDVYDMDLVKQVIIAHKFWRLRGLKTDLIILNEESMGYENPLYEQINRLINAYAYENSVDSPGGIFLRNKEQIPEDDLTLFLSVARVILIAARGSLRQQLVSPMPVTTYPPLFKRNKFFAEVPSDNLPFQELQEYNGLGGFLRNGADYSIYFGKDTHTPSPWINVIANPNFGTIVSETGGGYSWFGNSQSNRLTTWSNDPILDSSSEVVYIRDEDLGVVWTPKPGPIREQDPYRVTHSQGYSLFEHNSHGIDQEVTIFVPVDETGGLPLRIERIKLTNHSPQVRHLTLTSYAEWVLGTVKEETQMHVITEWDPESQSLFARNRYNPDFGDCVAFASSIPAASSYTGDRTEFLGRNGTLISPAAFKRKSLSGHTGSALDPCAALQVTINLNPGEQKEVSFVLGYTKNPEFARSLIQKCRDKDSIDQLLEQAKNWWNSFLENIQVETPDPKINSLLNRWLPYQNLSCRIWGRSGFYQSSGAFGFRDQLQDVMAITYAKPHIAREHILLAASRQFLEGDVQHWWHPPSGGGIRTRISDDLLWLVFATAQYVRTTGDVKILDEQIPFLKAPPLEENQHEVYSVPEITTETATLLEHCRRAIYKSMSTGSHGLPLMGGGDWNDGMNLVGIHGKGESVWLAWFLIHVMNDFAELLTIVGQPDSGENYRMQAKRLGDAIEESSWDGAWYRRAYFDDGIPLGSKDSAECTIDSLAQSWAVISGAGRKDRIDTALKSAEEYLSDRQYNIVRLLTPPFDKTVEDPGYIKGYPPGVRENGGQYTHGSLWLALAFAKRGNGDKAVELLKMMSPGLHSQEMKTVDLYKLEPYVVAADIYDLKNNQGRGGWSWYTGSAGWMYRIWIEDILGFKLRGSIHDGDKLEISPCIPKDWKGYKIQYRYRKNTIYHIFIENPNHLSCPSNSEGTILELDGLRLTGLQIPLTDDGKEHDVRIII